jgi:transcription elongation factor Elf1
LKKWFGLVIFTVALFISNFGFGQFDFSGAMVILECPKCGEVEMPEATYDAQVRRGYISCPRCGMCIAGNCPSVGGNSSSSTYSTYDPYEAQRMAAEAETERLRQEALREAAHKKELREDAAKARKTWDKNDAETMASMEAMFASSSKKKIPKLQCDCDNGWRKCEWCNGTGLRDCTRYGCRDGKLVCGCVRPGVGPDPNCPDCGGSGEVECPICKGSGKVPCNWCEHGRVRCWACGHDFHYPQEDKPFEPIPDPLAEARAEAAEKLFQMDASSLPAVYQQRLAAARAAYLKSIAVPAPPSTVQTAQERVFERDRELYNQLLGKYGGNMPSDPAGQEKFMQELQSLVESDPERQLLVGKQVYADLDEAAQGNTALAQAIQVAGGAAVLVPSFNAKVMPLSKNNPRSQIKGPLGAYVPEILSKQKLKERLTVLEEYAVEKEAYRAKAERLHQANRELLSSLLAEYQEECDAFRAQQSRDLFSERDFIAHLYEKYKNDPGHKFDVEQMVERYIEVEKCDQIEFKAREAQDAAYREWKRLLDDYDGASQVAVEVNRAVKNRVKADLLDEMNRAGEEVYAREKALREKQSERKKLFWETHEKMRPQALEEYNRLPDARKSRQSFDSYLHTKVNNTVNPVISKKYDQREWELDDMGALANRGLAEFDRERIVRLSRRYHQLKNGTPLQQFAHQPVVDPETELESKYDLSDLFERDPLFEWRWDKSKDRKSETGDVLMTR